jgi:molybdopterin molybdotransferase
VLSTVALADGWVQIPESREGIPAGETVAVEMWEALP